MASHKRVLLWTTAVIAAVVTLNWAYQVLRKPSELLAPVGSVKTPAETWREYERFFRKYSTPVITPELLAALAQVEAAGNPVATTAWRLRVAADPRQVYRPASSAVGLFQLTDGTFAQAKRYCVREHAVREDCWFNALYTRVLPRHAVELTSAYLDRRVAAIVEGRRIAATLAQKQELAALIHLCGASAGDSYAARGFRLKPGQRCGEHDPRAYLARVATMKRLFARLKALG
jgi:Transglycosylase SLT domain